MLVLRAIVDQQQQTGRRQALHQAVQQGLGLRVNPVQVLEDHEQRLFLALPQQQALEGLQGALAALRGIEAPKGAVRREGLQQGEQRRDRVLQGLIQREYLARHLGAHAAGVIAVVDLAIGFEQRDDRQIPGGFAIGDGMALQEAPPLGAMRAGALIHQARLADSGLPHQRHHLSPPRACAL